MTAASTPAQARYRRATCSSGYPRASAFRLRHNPFGRQAGCRDRTVRPSPRRRDRTPDPCREYDRRWLRCRRRADGCSGIPIIGAADEGAELSGLEVELAGAAGRALPGIAAILAWRVDVRPEHVVERIQHLG